MRVVAAWRQRAAIVAEMKLGFRAGKGIDVESKRIEIVCDVIRRAKINSRSETGVGANFQQALENFKRGKTYNRISVSCHVSRLPLVGRFRMFPIL